MLNCLFLWVAQSEGTTNDYHPLQYTWVFWFMHRLPKAKIKDYEGSMKRIAAFSSVGNKMISQKTGLHNSPGFCCRLRNSGQCTVIYVDLAVCRISAITIYSSKVCALYGRWVTGIIYALRKKREGGKGESRCGIEERAKIRDKYLYVLHRRMLPTLMEASGSYDWRKV